MSAGNAAEPLSEPTDLVPTAEQPTAAAPVRLRDGLRFGLLVFAGVWVGWAVLALVGVTIVPTGDAVSVPGLDASPFASGWRNVLFGGDRADALWYERIASSGYRSDDGSAAFFPLFPMAIALLSAVTGLGAAAAALVVAQLSFLGALVVLYALTARETDRETARRAAVYLAVFPTAFFCLVPYTEAPFLLLVLLVFWYARGDNWELAVVPAFAVGLTRSVGVVLVAALACEAVVQWRAGRRLLPRLLVALAPAAGLLTYFGYWWVQGAALAPVRAQANWQREWTFPAVTLWDAVTHAWDYNGYWMIDLLIAGIAVAAIVVGIRMIPWSYSVYAVVSLLMPLSNPFPPRPLMSVPRFVVVIFPIFLVLAMAVGRGRLPHSLVVGVFAGGYALLGLLFLNGHSIF